MSAAAKIYDASDEIQIQAKRRKLTKAERDLIALMSLPEFRAFMWGLLARCGIFQSSMTGDNQTFFREGQRNVGLPIFADINRLCPEQYALMAKEAQEASDE